MPHLPLQRIIRILISLALVCLFLSHSVQLYPLGFLNQLENLSYDFRLRMTMPNTQDDEIVILDIDEKSLSQVGQWPWPRDILAKSMDLLFNKYKIKIIGFDVVFAETDESSGLKLLETLSKDQLASNQEYLQLLEQIKPTLENDRIFAQSLANRNVILGFIFQRTTDEKLANRIGSLPTSLGEVDKHYKRRLSLHENIDYTANLNILQDNAMSGGFFDYPSGDSDGIVRRVPLLQIYDNQIYQSLALAVARAALANPNIVINISDDQATHSYYAIETLSLGQANIPVDGKSAVLVPYRGDSPKFKYISMADVLTGRVDAAVLENKIALIGTSAAGLRDLRSTPVSDNYPGVEVHANIISGILNQTIKHRPEFTVGYEVSVMLIFGLILSLLLPFISPLITLLVTTGFIALLCFGNFYYWQSENLVLPIAAHLTLIVSIFVLHMSYGFFVESRGKRQLKRLFGQYVPPELVDEMNKNPEHPSMQSQSKPLTVLFTDVRNFTNISESMEPHELSKLINGFLTPMTQIIHKHRGTIDKYIGDAIMAFWGAPLDDEFHVRNALLAAMEMVNKLQILQTVFRANNWPEIKIGVGINTGTMRVGNMGSEFRMAYTVMGDAVNLASRLEGLTKQYSVQIIVSERVKYNVPEFEYRELDLVRVKGKDKPIRIFEPLGHIDSIDKSLKSELRRYHTALKLYRNKEWDSAEREFFSLATKNKQCLVYQLYVDRIMYYRNHPPLGQWDGVFVPLSK